MEGKGECSRIFEGKRRIGTFGGVVIDGDTARGDLGALLCVRDVTEDDIAGQAISDLECSHLCFPVAFLAM
jgi:hypothetical protein